MAVKYPVMIRITHHSLTLVHSRVQVPRKIKKSRCCDSSLFGARDGTWRLLRLRLACWWLADRRLATVPGSPLLAKNSPQDCIFTLRPSRVQDLRKIKKSRYCDSSLFGARDGTWTRTGLPHAPQTCASADSATLADVRSANKWYYSRTLHQCQYLNAKNTHLF